MDYEYEMEGEEEVWVTGRESPASISGEDEDSPEKMELSPMNVSELEPIKNRVRELEEEAEKLKHLQAEVDRQMNIAWSPVKGTSGGGLSQFPTLSLKEIEADGRSVFVGNVDYSTDVLELEEHFVGCGPINRITIQCNQFDSSPKGFAYIEFSGKESVAAALEMDDTLFKERQLKVMAKRTNLPGRGRGSRPPRGGVPRGGVPWRGRGRGSYRGSSFSESTDEGTWSYFPPR